MVIMDYKKYDCGAYRLHVVKTNKFKSVHIEVQFRSEMEREEAVKRTMLVDYLTDTCNNYPTHKDMAIRLEELYNTSYYGSTSRTGNILNSVIVSDFISPKYIDEKNYLEEVVSFLCEILFNPKADNNEFSEVEFNVVKEKIKLETVSIDNNPVRKSIKRALENVCKNTRTSYSLFGNLEMIDKVTPRNLYDSYLNMLDNDSCDIFVIGDIDSELLNKLFEKYFTLKSKNTSYFDLYVNNEFSNKTNVIEEKDKFVQTSLNIIYNVQSMSDYEKNIVFPVFNYLLGSGGLTCKLYQTVSEKNSLCYSIGSIFLKYDYLYIIQVSLEEKDKDKSISLIKKCVKEMQDGIFSDVEIDEAKINLINSLDMSLDSSVSILNSYVYNYLDNLPLLEERKELFKKVTREDIINVSKKIKINTIYSLVGEQNEKDRN